MTTLKLLGTAVVAILLGLPACSGPKPCTEPSETCPCPATAHGDSALVVLTDKASPSFTEAMKRVTAEDTEAFEGGRLGLDRTPTVILATYDAIGSIKEFGSFNLAGEGDSASRKAANARLQAACLARTVAEVPTEGRGNLLRSLSSASALASARGEKGSAILAFGLGRSSVEKLDLDKIDLGSPEARKNVIQELTRVGILGTNQPAALTFVDPDEGIESGITGGFINTFVDRDLCPAVTKGRCQRLDVLP